MKKLAILMLMFLALANCIKMEDQNIQERKLPPLGVKSEGFITPYQIYSGHPTPGTVVIKYA